MSFKSLLASHVYFIGGYFESGGGSYDPPAADAVDYRFFMIHLPLLLNSTSRHELLKLYSNQEFRKAIFKQPVYVLIKTSQPL